MDQIRENDQAKIDNASFVFKIRWRLYGPVILSLPLLGLGFCVIYSIVYDFDEANATHCNVSIHYMLEILLL